MKSGAAAAKPRRYVQGVRAEAAEATARRIVDAFLARLMTQWFDEITLDRVAEDAGVTVQTVVRRFGGKGGLLGEAVKELATQINARRATPSGDIARLVENVIADYEETGDAVLRLLALEPRQPALRETIAFGRSEHRRWVSEVFAERLGKLDGSVRKRVIDGLVVTTDVYIWKLLRRDMGKSVGATAAIMTGMVRATIAELSKSNSSGEGR